MWLRRAPAGSGGQIVGLSIVDNPGGPVTVRRDQVGAWDLLASDLGTLSGLELNTEVRRSPERRSAQMRQHLLAHSCAQWG